MTATSFSRVRWRPDHFRRQVTVQRPKTATNITFRDHGRSRRCPLAREAVAGVHRQQQRRRRRRAQLPASRLLRKKKSLIHQSTFGATPTPGGSLTHLCAGSTAEGKDGVV